MTDFEVWDGLTGEMVARFGTREEAEAFIGNDENLSIHQPPRPRDLDPEEPVVWAKVDD